MNLIDTLEWQGNSKAMYRGILNAIPALFRGTVQRSIGRWLLENNVKTVTEDTVFRAVHEIAPPNIARQILPELEKMRT